MSGLGIDGPTPPDRNPQLPYCTPAVRGPERNGSINRPRRRYEGGRQRTPQLTWIGRAMVAAAAIKIAATAALGLRFDPCLLASAILFAVGGGLVWSRSRGRAVPEGPKDDTREDGRDS